MMNFDNALLPDTDTLASDEFESLDRRLPTKEELKILNLIKPTCPKCNENYYGRWHLYSRSNDGMPIEILWICWNHPEKSPKWPSVQYNINDLFK